MRNAMRNFFRPNPYRALEKAVGYSFRRRRLLETALLHRSFRHENEGIEDDNERLEFLGDSALGLAAGAWLYRRFPDLQEGDLTRLRSQITSGKPLAQLGRELGLGAYLKLGRGEQLTGGQDRASNLENALEALIGAAYLDGGMAAVEKIFKKLLVPLAEPLGDTAWEDNPKGKLQEVSQKRWRVSPKYRVLGQDGPPHAKIFRVRAELKNGAHGQGQGRTKRDAEAQAAADALRKLGVNPERPG
jgi:ribonuclease-3